MDAETGPTTRALAPSSGTYPPPVSEGRSRNMRAIRRSDTQPEVALRRLLHALGLRFRKDYRLDLPGGRVRPDVVFIRAKVAIFVDSCFWHSCPIHLRQPRVNDWYWGPKLARTVERDLRDNEVLMEAGWTVLRYWTHEDLTDVAAVVKEVVRPAR